MLIDNEKFIALLSDNSGIEKEKVEKYLEELISEMKTSFDEGEGYEVEGFGIFSKLGSNILFIPSEELETEINYKYVGMEPIELPGGQEQQETKEEEENPIQGILDGGGTEEREEYEDPFAELFNEAEEHEKSKQEEESLDLTEDEIEAVVEEEIESEDAEEIVAESPVEEDIDDLEESLKDIFGEEESNEESDEEIEAAEEEESIPGPKEWGIDAHKEEEQEDVFSGLLGDEAEETELIDEDDIFATEDELVDEEDVFETEEKSTEEEIIEEEGEEEIDFSALEDDGAEDDFEDPFESLEEEDDNDFVPVVTNVSSGKTSKKEESTEAEDPKESKRTEKKSKTPKNPRERKKGAPVFLYMVLGLVVLGGAGYLLAYFGVVNIEGITPSSTPTQIVQNTPPVVEPESIPAQTTETEEEQPNNTIPEIEETTSNQIDAGTENTPQNLSENTGGDFAQAQDNDIAPLVADEKAPGEVGIITPLNGEENAEPYGLNGTATTAGNNGYTIVLYTLSRKSGADAQFEKLSGDGFRVIIKEKPSTEFGTLYRVSIGQFRTLADAAIAAEKVDAQILGNYIITKI
ncbi:MAG TPA: hypothetical protein DEO59_06915 [Balneola sp.]|jgi:cytoskeletal protein RodZ|nr:hypothetical protein [Balneola sp.]MAO77419.1 hypothetical protein [Balneola sp.]MBF65377.1 hypothetical protein [Balneola sp.]HBZ38208.1 hypothetical protein [Balneola sp.]|tara:strand:- start:17406 stop:19139 length:1734 start_codon:yes stop_codon:yes gene_type:complete